MIQLLLIVLSISHSFSPLGHLPCFLTLSPPPPHPLFLTFSPLPLSLSILFSLPSIDHLPLFISHFLSPSHPLSLSLSLASFASNHSLSLHYLSLPSIGHLPFFLTSPFSFCPVRHLPLFLPLSIDSLSPFVYHVCLQPLFLSPFSFSPLHHLPFFLTLSLSLSNPLSMFASNHYSCLPLLSIPFYIFLFSFLSFLFFALPPSYCTILLTYLSLDVIQSSGVN